MYIIFKPVARALLGLIVLAAATALAGCASPRIDAQWTAPQLGVEPLRSGRVFIVCEATQEVLRRLCIDQLRIEIAKRGMQAVEPVADLMPAAPAPNQARDDARFLAAARTVGARWLWVSTVVPDVQAPDNGGSGFSIGLGGFGIGARSAVGIGIAVPIGGSPSPTERLSADARVLDVPSSRLLWTARARSGGSGDPQEQIVGLVRRLADAAGEARLY